MTLVVVEEVVGPLAVAFAVIMMTAGVAVIVMESGIAMVSVKTGMRDGMRGVKRVVRIYYYFYNVWPALSY